MFRNLIPTLTLILFASLPVFAQDSDSKDKPLDVRSSIGDLHVGKDATAEKAGLPLYPGARHKHEDNDPLNFGILTESFGIQLIVAKYETDDSPEKVIAYYRDRMKKYGKVLACDNQDDNSGSHINLDDEKEIATPLKCEGNNTGPVRELKVGTQGNAHFVAIDPNDNSKGTTFAIVYLRRRGKTGDI
jgi:hypothetical protein